MLQGDKQESSGAKSKADTGQLSNLDIQKQEYTSHNLDMLQARLRRASRAASSASSDGERSINTRGLIAVENCWRHRWEVLVSRQISCKTVGEEGLHQMGLAGKCQRGGAPQAGCHWKALDGGAGLDGGQRWGALAPRETSEVGEAVDVEN
ncbi:unnamed protein product [Lactuca virosa]|uniref:Uncharacterized protein n=1 Tax=Lactuca virosa TaxID=75947 RepID=A0AAU9M5K3_9ASTR|nr:unnamed protein product [Lactuca virosa]